MAGISNFQGYWQLNYVPPSGKRQTLRLRGATEMQARVVKSFLERLIISTRFGVAAEADVLEWLLKVDDRIHRQLERNGLAIARSFRTVGELAEWFIELHRKRSKPSTVMNTWRATDRMTKYFGASRRLTSIRTADAEAFRNWLSKGGASNGGRLAPATVSRTCKRCREMFTAALRRGCITANPFAEMKGWVETNSARDVYVPRELIEQLIAATDDLELRSIIAIVRYAGVRCPSEVQPLRWEWIEWDANCMRISSPKTEHHESKKERLVPMFAEVRTHFETLRAAVKIGEGEVFPRHRGSRAAITGRLQTLCRRIEVPIWTKPFVNMRASCERDWLKNHSIDEVAAWMGHSPTIALKHYNRAIAESRARSAVTRQEANQRRAA